MQWKHAKTTGIEMLSRCMVNINVMACLVVGKAAVDAISLTSPLAAMGRKWNSWSVSGHVFACPAQVDVSRTFKNQVVLGTRISKCGSGFHPSVVQEAKQYRGVQPFSMQKAQELEDYLKGSWLLLPRRSFQWLPLVAPQLAIREHEMFAVCAKVFYCRTFQDSRCVFIMYVRPGIGAFKGRVLWAKVGPIAAPQLLWLLDWSLNERLRTLQGGRGTQWFLARWYIQGPKAVSYSGSAGVDCTVTVSRSLAPARLKDIAWLPCTHLPAHAPRMVPSLFWLLSAHQIEDDRR